MKQQFSGRNGKEIKLFRQTGKCLMTSVSIKQEFEEIYYELRKFCSTRGISIGQFMIDAYQEHYQLDSPEEIRIQLEGISEGNIDRTQDSVEEVLSEKFSEWSSHLVTKHAKDLKRKTVRQSNNTQSN